MLLGGFVFDIFGTLPVHIASIFPDEQFGFRLEVYVLSFTPDNVFCSDNRFWYSYVTTSSTCQTLWLDLDKKER